MRSTRFWAYSSVVFLALTGLMVAVTPPQTPEPKTEPVALAKYISAGRPSDTIVGQLPAEYQEKSALTAAKQLADDPELAVRRAAAEPDTGDDDRLVAGAAALTGGDIDAAAIAEVYSQLPDEITDWWAVLYPSQIGNLEGAPYQDRIAANRIRGAAALAESAKWPSPDRPWTSQPRPQRPDLQAIVDGERRMVYFDPHANGGQGAWAEAHGDLDNAAHVAVLVPGGSAFLVGDNFGRYSARAESLVEAGEGELAVIVWAAAPFPSGWIEEAFPSWAQRAAPPLADFVNDLRYRLPSDTSLTLVGHSYGGAIVGLAETETLAADRVLHIASAGAGYGVNEPSDYQEPCRPRYAMMAPGDPIDFVQDIPGGTGVGHGSDVAWLDGTHRLETGYLPDDPQALDDVGRTLGSQDITGKRIGGIHAHSEVFIPDSDAWRNILRVMTEEPVELADPQPDRDSHCE